MERVGLQTYGKEAHSMRMKATILAAVAALFVLALAASAYAAPGINLRAGLELTERGTPVPAGGQVVSENLLVNGECLEASYGKLLNNGAPVDVVQVDPPVYDHCQSGSLSGGLSYVALSDTGSALVVAMPALALTTPAGCVYDLTLLAGEFTIGDETVAYITGEATGLRSPASSKTCARTIKTAFSVGESGQDGFLLITELTSGGFKF
jgi:hypothetical protein